MSRKLYIPFSSREKKREKRARLRYELGCPVLRIRLYVYRSWQFGTLCREAALHPQETVFWRQIRELSPPPLLRYFSKGFSRAHSPVGDQRARVAKERSTDREGKKERALSPSSPHLDRRIYRHTDSEAIVRQLASP